MYCFTSTGLLRDIFCCLYIIHKRLTVDKELKHESVGRCSILTSNGGILCPPLLLYIYSALVFDQVEYRLNNQTARYSKIPVFHSTVRELIAVLLNVEFAVQLWGFRICQLYVHSDTFAGFQKEKDRPMILAELSPWSHRSHHMHNNADLYNLWTWQTTWGRHVYVKLQ